MTHPNKKSELNRAYFPLHINTWVNDTETITNKVTTVREVREAREGSVSYRYATWEKTDACFS